MAEFPMKARQEFTRYSCEECGTVTDSHKMRPDGYGDPAAVCSNCGVAALRRDIDPDLADLIAQGVPFVPATDYWAVEVEGYSQTEWAKKRGATQQAVSKNILRVVEVLPDS